MSAQIPIDPIEKIEFGKALLASDLECALLYIVYCFGDSAHLDTGAHLLYKYLEQITTVFAQITSPVLVANSVAQPAVALRNICRLARMQLEGDSLIHIINNLSEELATYPDGTVATAGANRALTDLYIDVALLVVGGGLSELVGTWDNQKYVTQDEILGGMWIVLFYILQFWNMHISSILTLLTASSEFVKEKSSLRGNYRPLIPGDQKTWGSILLSQENTPAVNVFGISTAALDDPTLRAITCVKLDGFERLMNKLLAPSQWTWRYARWLQVHPVYFITNPESGTDGAIYTDYDEVMLMVDGTNHKYRTFNNLINEFVADLKSFYFKNKAYANLKSKLSFVPFGEFPTIAASGNGGLVAHQFTNWVDGGVLSTDSLTNKLRQDTDNAGHMCLQTRRVFNQNKRFLMIGDIDVDDYRLQVFSMAGNVDAQDGQNVTVIGRNFTPFEQKSYFGFGISKTEDEAYKIGRAIYDGVSILNENSDLQGTVPAPFGWTLYTNSESVTYPISLARSKTLFYYGRNADPYKKLTHQVVDINELDVDKVLKTARSYILPMSSGISTIPATPIAVSAITSAPIVSDDINSKKETTVGEPLPVSATVKKEDKKEDKK